MAGPTSITTGGSSVLTWTTSNATSFTLNRGIGLVTPTVGGTQSVSPAVTTTYTGTAVGPGGTVTCNATVTVTPPVTPTPVCTLSASASSVTRGSTVDLTWTTSNVTSTTIDNGVGVVTPVSGGTRSVTVNANTIYVLTAVGNNGSTITCSAPVTVTTVGSSPVCLLTASPTNITTGSSFELTWGGANITQVFIDQGVGTTTSTSGSRNITPPAAGEYTYTGTFTTNTGSRLTCTAPVVVTNGGGGGGCTSNCGGGGGGGGSGPRVLLSSLKAPGEQPLAFVYLSQIPYTGLDLGPWGTAMYWIMLILWSLAAAYLVLFSAMPFALKRVNAFGSQVKETLAGDSEVPEPVQEYASISVEEAPVARTYTAPEPTIEYQATEGFRTFAQGAALTIDDIVKGLAREAEARPTATAHELRPNFMIREEEQPHYEPAPVPEPLAAKPEPVAQEAAPVNADVSDFITALLQGDRDTVFATIRSITRTGGNSEEFLTHAVCALDEAYRSQVDGSVCHPEIARLTSECHPNFLEKIVTALTTAVDGSYSTGVTGVKLALTRALSVVNG